MPNPFTTAGATPERASKFAPLYVNEFWTGLYSNSNPLREAAVPFLYQKFYSGARFETIRGGQNIEISPRLTLIRRPGNSVYNSATFSAINTFYSFRVFNPLTLATQIRVIADTATAVYDATGPSGQTLLYTKSTGAGQTSFQSVGNILYAGDGVDTWKYIWNPPWTANTTYKPGNVIGDSNANGETAYAGKNVHTGAISNVAVASNIATIKYTGTLSSGWLTPGLNIILAGVVTATFVNLVPLQVISVANVSGSTWKFTASLNHPDYGPTADTGGSIYNVGTFAALYLSGSSAPTWAGPGGYTVDNDIIWKNNGISIQSWGLVAPVAAPAVANIPNTNTGTAWAANTYYNPSLCIVDSNNNVQLLTTGGTTGSSVPTWNVTTGGTTADSAGGGTAVWTNQGTSVRATTTAYAVGAIIAVSYSYNVTTQVITGYNQGGPIYGSVTTTYGPYYYFFQCVTAGTSSALANAQITWQTTNVTDGTVVWNNIGPWITRTTSASAAGSATAKGNIGNSQLVSLLTQIIDSNGNFQNISLAGESGGAAPTWLKASGSVTSDNQAVWINGGPSVAANSGAWQYGYAFLDSTGKQISSMSPPSALVTLAASSLVNVSGTGDPNFATDGVDTIVIYRTVQGANTSISGGTFFQLATIVAPPNGGPWSYQDNSPDPPATGSILNNFIEADVTGNNAPPPKGLTNLTYYLSRIFGSVGNLVYWSGVTGQPVGVGQESWPGLNFFQMPELVNTNWGSATGLLIFTVHGVYFSQGVDNNLNPSQPVKLLEDIGLLSPNLFTVNGSLPTLFTSDFQMLTLDPSSGVNRVSDPIADVLSQFSNTNSYVAWHTNGIDSAYFIADGSTGWYRLAPTSAPESGFTWSPNAQIVGGVKCIKSIETTPGVKQLLLGPTTSGPILARDLTTNQDNGASYTANVTIGSFVFAQPGQCGEIVSITTTCKAVGSHPAVSILGDEISGSFELLSQAVTDPPFLNPPASLFSDRWYFSTLQQPAYMRHMQMNIAFPAENQPNEVLEYAIFGRVLSE
jgi:hypothetical protein